MPGPEKAQRWDIDAHTFSVTGPTPKAVLKELRKAIPEDVSEVVISITFMNDAKSRAEGVIYSAVCMVAGG